MGVHGRICRTERESRDEIYRIAAYRRMGDRCDYCGADSILTLLWEQGLDHPIYTPAGTIQWTMVPVWRDLGEVHVICHQCLRTR